MANVGDSLRRLCYLQHRIYNLLGVAAHNLDDDPSSLDLGIHNALEIWRKIGLSGD